MVGVKESLREGALQLLLGLNRPMVEKQEKENNKKCLDLNGKVHIFTNLFLSQKKKILKVGLGPLL
jgi:hypothetical protein